MQHKSTCQALTHHTDIGGVYIFKFFELIEYFKKLCQWSIAGWLVVPYQAVHKKLHAIFL